ncbi:hypothetical protein MCUN1_003659 [Malassezia cuniculi]|uniref:NADH:flavin oxidoreductase/NADH oxidase N-terminal domain-containing protein n=1 Tax=Malassezia cuniculi TaxID=948313 RepID=A0AAF0F1Q1_9BASI|nr:hypothetical protein MCUN1_003659 [Malassezia cuniculi]
MSILYNAENEAKEDLHLQPAFYGGRFEGNRAQGTLPDDWLPEGAERPKLFETVTVPNGSGTLTLKNRIVLPPMCMYSSEDGFPTPFHLAHLGQFALHGYGTIIVEATAVVPEGRISPEDVGIWKDEHVKAHASLVSGLKSFGGGVKVGIQIAHAGRKASDWSPFYMGKRDTVYATEKDNGWPDKVVAPSPVPYDEGHIKPHELTVEEIHKVEDAFVAAAERAYRAGYDFVQIHAAHGYLISEFNSPKVNKRTDDYGGSFENRIRLLRTVAQRIRSAFPDKGLWVRVNSTDAIEHTGEESWTVEDAKKLAPLLEEDGVDVLDLSAGGTVSYNKFQPDAGYMAGWASEVKAVGLQRMLISAVGRLGRGTPEEPEKLGALAEYYVKEKHIDLVCVGRDSLAIPTWVEEAARHLSTVGPIRAPQYCYVQSRFRGFW